MVEASVFAWESACVDELPVLCVQPYNMKAIIMQMVIPRCNIRVFLIILLILFPLISYGYVIGIIYADSWANMKLT